MYTITVVLPMRLKGKLLKRKIVYEFSNRSHFNFELWGMLQSDNYRINDDDPNNVTLIVDNGNIR